MKECLLVEWISKLVQREDALWFKILQAKYMPDEGLHKAKHLFKWGAIHQVRYGRQTNFWNDVWIEVPLKISYPMLFRICDDPEIVVAECWKEDGWEISFRRTMGAREV
ncbi:hypothetical protein BS78_03G013200 [Paspalum vaginatum]|nr:hypothetical protein BS78_03G013200 [Paspalum vaginatum]